MDKLEEMRQWIAIADSDLAVAEHTIKTMWPVPDEIICYHCQQCAEKYLKWVLVFYDRDVPHIHNLVDLEKLCETIEPRFSELYSQCAVLTRFGILPKYPKEIQIDTDDAKRAIAYAKILRDFVRAQFSEYFGDVHNREAGANHA